MQEEHDYKLFYVTCRILILLVNKIYGIDAVTLGFDNWNVTNEKINLFVYTSECTNAQINCVKFRTRSSLKINILSLCILKYAILNCCSVFVIALASSFRHGLYKVSERLRFMPQLHDDKQCNIKQNDKFRSITGIRI